MTDQAQGLELARSGVPLFRVEVASGAGAAEEFAAEELRRHLLEMVGVGPHLRNSSASRGSENGVVLHVNDREAAARAGIAPALRPEQFHLESREGALYLLGGGPRGVLYGVYELLDHLGCRWFTPELSRVPRDPNLRLPPLVKTGGPAFEFRDTFNWECRDPLWWVRNRMNGWYTPVPEYMGGHVDYCGFVHTFDGLVPPEEFFGAHPEYFSLLSGVRRRDGGQLCLTNPEVLRIVTERVLERMRQNPRATIFSVSQNDCTGPCECPACRAVVEEEGSQSGPILRFVNAVAAETSKVYPDKLLDTLAYWYSLDAPRKVTPHPNVRVRLCSINCCQGHGYGTCDHKESARFLRALEEWGRRTPQMYIWHYATNFANYPLPMPDLEELHANIGLYRKHGVYGVFIQSQGEEGGGAEAMGLRGYVVSRLLWNPDQSVWPLVDEFLAAVYGAAAPHVRRYLDAFHDRVRRDGALHPSLYDPPTHRLFDEETCAPAERALAEGEALVAGAERRRVSLLRGGLRYARLMRVCGEFRREGDVYRGAATDEDRREFGGLVQLWREAGVQCVREGEWFEFTVQKIGNRLGAHRVEWLRDAGQEIAVVPALGGRLLEWHAGGRQWLAPADPANNWLTYPMSEGYAEFVVVGLYGYSGWGETYRAARRGDALVLSAEVNRTLELTRALTFRNGELRVASRLTNAGPAAVACAWGCGLHLLAPPEAAVVFNDAATSVRLEWRDLPEGLGAARTLTGPQRPRGTWRVETAGAVLTHEHLGVPAERAIVGRLEAKGVLALDLRTPHERLEPGKTVEFTQRIRISPL
jgi:hypothetical protein